MSELSLETYLLLITLGSILLGGAAIAFHVFRTVPVTGEAKKTGAIPNQVVASGLDPDTLHENSLRLFNEAAALLKVIRQQMDAGDRFSNTLAEEDKKLPKLSDPEQVRLVIKFLVSENAKMQQEQSELRSRLEQSQCQVEALRFKVAEAEEVSLRDPLTSVANRRGFDTALAQAVADVKALRTPLCLVMCDLDHFKKLNDKYGHPVGDDVLKAFAGILGENVRTGDTIARYGGEEFAIILTRSDMKTAARVCERMRLDLASRKIPLIESGEVLEAVTASFGIAQCLSNDTPESLVKRADEKLYEAKNGGRNRVVIDRSALAA